MSDIIFLSWDGRPAIVDSSGESALAILSPGTDWVAVSGPDVFRSGEVIMDEESFRLKFADRFGSFNIPKHIPIKKLSYDYEKADQEVMEYLETPIFRPPRVRHYGYAAFISLGGEYAKRAWSMHNHTRVQNFAHGARVSCSSLFLSSMHREYAKEYEICAVCRGSDLSSRVSSRSCTASMQKSMQYARYAGVQNLPHGART